MMNWTPKGMLSRGVTLPDSTWSGNRTSISSRPNCGMERARVPRKMPSAVVANNCRAVPARNSASEPWTGTLRMPSTTTASAKADATSTTSPIAHTLLIMISNGVTGITSRCSTVPCSRSRIRAAPDRMMESRVTWLITSITEPNQALLYSGLKRARRSRLTGEVMTAAWWLRAKVLTSPRTMDWM